MSPDEEAYAYGKRPLRLLGRRIEFLGYHKQKHHCPVCGMTAIDKDLSEFSYTKPDMYEQQAGIDLVRRFWGKCHTCGMIQQIGSLTPDQSVALYTNGYRSVKMRNASVREEFFRILTSGQSENLYRVAWIMRQVQPKSVLDIGSGLGLFPFEMVRINPSVTMDCFEPNADAHEFISDFLGISCCNGFYTPNVFKRMYDSGFTHTCSGTRSQSS